MRWRILFGEEEYDVEAAACTGMGVSPTEHDITVLSASRTPGLDIDLFRASDISLGMGLLQGVHRSSGNQSAMYVHAGNSDKAGRNSRIC